jgi:hypothetical protein
MDPVGQSRAESVQLTLQLPDAQYCPSGQSLFFSQGPAFAQLIAAGTTMTSVAKAKASGEWRRVIAPS